MKCFRILILVFSIATVHLNNIYAQTDYVITKNKDTIFCKIKGSFFNGNLKYKARGEGNYVKLDTNKVIQYFVANDTATFIYSKLPGKISGGFVKWREKGRINLYELITSSSGYQTTENVIAVLSFGGGGSMQQPNKYWFISKGTDSLVQIKTDAVSKNNVGTRKDREKSFLDMVADCPYVVTEIKYADLDKNYDFDVIRGFIKMYNEQCPNK